jgi:NAD(P)-dependent dehydrogenase (short-subunit alcohol dehydrogenase family)
MPMTKPKDTWLITGAAGGLGQHLDTASLDAGQIVLATDLKGDTLPAPEDEARSRLRMMALNVTDAGAARETVRYALPGAFLAGVALNLDGSETASHPECHFKLNARSYGFMIPVCFVSSGFQLGLRALTTNPSAMARIPLFLLALVIVRGAPAIFYVRTVPIYEEKEFRQNESH